MRPICRVRHETVLDRVEMRVVHVSREVAIIANWCSQYRRCQMPRSPRLVMTGDRADGQRFCKRDLLDRPPATGKIGIALRQRPQTVHVVGKHDPGVDMKRCAGAHLPNRVAHRVDARQLAA